VQREENRGLKTVVRRYMEEKKLERSNKKEKVVQFNWRNRSIEEQEMVVSNVMNN
jgi:hypothetical protein